MVTDISLQIGQPIPTGAAGVILSVSISGGPSATSTSASTSTAIGTLTTKGSSGGIISSVLSHVTMKSESSKNIQPGGSDIFRTITLFAVCGIAGLGGMIAVILGIQ